VWTHKPQPFLLLHSTTSYSEHSSALLWPSPHYLSASLVASDPATCSPSWELKRAVLLRFTFHEHAAPSRKKTYDPVLFLVDRHYRERTCTCF
jgi:hypothetical protein